MLWKLRKKIKLTLLEEKTNQTLDKLFTELRVDDMSKPEPKTDMKKERVDPEIEIGSHWQSIDGKVITIDFVKNDLVVWTYEFNDREQITLSTNKEIFIKDFKELKRK